MMKDFIYPILALSLICLVMAGSLALVNNVTYPIIKEAAEERAYETMRQITPHVTQFELLDIEQFDHLPITSAYRAIGQLDYIMQIWTEGYIFIINTHGFGGEMQVMVGISWDGRILGSSVLAHNETISFANRVFAISNEQESNGRSLLDVDAVSGATRTFRAYQNALNYAIEAFEIVRGTANE